MAGRALALFVVWWFGEWTIGSWAFSAGPQRLLAIPWAIVTVAALLFAMTGWPFTRKRRIRFGLLLVVRLAAGLCVLWFGLWMLSTLTLFDRSQHVLAIPLAILTVAALLFAITGWPFARKRSRQSAGEPPSAVS